MLRAAAISDFPAQFPVRRDRLYHSRMIAKGRWARMVMGAVEEPVEERAEVLA